MRKLTVLLIACVLASSVSGCGGGSGGTTTATGTTAATGTTQGVDTPAAISVVTAK
jgi:hypothetical protein